MRRVFKKTDTYDGGTVFQVRKKVRSAMVEKRQRTDSFVTNIIHTNDQKVQKKNGSRWTSAHREVEGLTPRPMPGTTNGGIVVATCWFRCRTVLVITWGMRLCSINRPRPTSYVTSHQFNVICYVDGGYNSPHSHSTCYPTLRLSLYTFKSSLKLLFTIQISLPLITIVSIMLNLSLS